MSREQPSARRFCSYMNLPHPVNPKSYIDCNNALYNAGKNVALSTMKDAVMELHNDANDKVACLKEYLMMEVVSTNVIHV